jgi:glucose/arabinose dehydrogenase
MAVAAVPQLGRPDRRAARVAVSLALALALASLAGCDRSPEAIAAQSPGSATGGGPRATPGPCGVGPVTAGEPGPSHVRRPASRPATPDRVARIRVPVGFRVDVVARDLQNTRMLAVGDDGTLYVTRDRQGDVLALHDDDGDGRADRTAPVATALPSVNGIALRGGRAYLATPTRVYVADVLPGGALGERRVLAEGLPPGGRHPNRTLAFGPDGMLYVSVGSSCDACVESNPEHAALVRMRPDGTARAVFARGLRNTIGFGWHPTSRQLWGMDHGSDQRGDGVPPEELNSIREGGHYGWPFCFSARALDPVFLGTPPGGASRAEFCRSTCPAALGYTAHAAPMAMVFYTGAQFPEEYRGDAFVAMHGSWNRDPPSGFEVARVRFRDGSPTGFAPFLSGFLVEDGAAQFGRPVGLAVAHDGSLLLSEDQNGVIYRVSYGPPPSPSPSPPTARPGP